MLELNKFDDLVLLNIFKQLNLNERAQLKLVSKRFNYLVDLLSISNCVIFDRMPVIESNFKYSNEYWNSTETVYVTDLNKFIERFEIKLENVRKLVIFGVNEGSVQFEINLKRLTHLELYNLKFSSTKILRSAKLENYYHREVSFDDKIVLNVDKLNNTSLAKAFFIDPFVGFAHQLKQIDYLNLPEMIHMRDIDLISNELNLKQIKIAARLEIAELLWNKFKSLRIFDLLLTGIGQFDVEIDLQMLDNVIAKKRDDFELYIWGIKVNQETIQSFLKFYYHTPMSCTFKLIFERVNLFCVHCGIFDHIERHNEMLEKFYDLIEIITFEKHLQVREKVFRQMKNVRDIYMNLTFENGLNFDKFLHCWPLLNRLEIVQTVETGLSNSVFDLIPIYCKNIYHLKIYCFEEMTFDFLFQMKNLKYLILNLYHPIQNEIVLELIKNLKHLAFFQVHFHQSGENISKDNLKQFKEEVNSFVENELKFKNAKFTIVIRRSNLRKQKSKECAMLRYTYERSKYIEDRFQNNSNDDLESLLKVIEFKGIERPKQIVFNDKIMVKILSFLNLNERTNCRLVSHQFKKCSDQILIYKLIVFDRIPCTPGKFRLTDERFDLQDSVYVYDMTEFFNSKTIANCMKPIEKLVIFGSDIEKIELTVHFDKLNYLEIHRVFFVNECILESPNIKTFFTFGSLLVDPETKRMINQKFHPTKFNLIGFDRMKSKLKHFGSSDIFENEIELYRQCVEKKVFEELEILDCHLNSFETLIYISQNFPNLKQINLRFGESFYHLRNHLSGNSLTKLHQKLRKNLKVNFFGIPFKQSTIQTIERFFLMYSDDLKMKIGDILLTASSKWNKFKSQFGSEEKLFKEFFDQIKVLQFSDNLKDKSFYKRFKNLECVHFYFQTNYGYGLPATLKNYPNIIELLITCYSSTSYDQRILDAIPNYSPQITKTTIENWEKNFNFNFILNLPNLSAARITLRFPFDQTLFIQILRNLKYLSLFEVHFEQPEDLSKDQLRAFKKLVIRCTKEELKLENSVFKIEIHKRILHLTGEEFKICRYIFKRNCDGISASLLNANDELMDKMIEHLSNKRDPNRIKSKLEQIFFNTLCL